MKVKLKPCPWCGDVDNLRVCVLGGNKEKPLGWFVVCDFGPVECGAQGPIKNTKLAARRAWQKRKVKK